MTNEDVEAADAIARGLNDLLADKQKVDIMRAFGFIISSWSLDCPCTNIDDSLDIAREAAEAHYACNIKPALQ